MRLPLAATNKGYLDPVLRHVAVGHGDDRLDRITAPTLELHGGELDALSCRGTVASRRPHPWQPQLVIVLEVRPPARDQ